jgi:hypothetical protein
VWESVTDPVTRVAPLSARKAGTTVLTFAAFPAALSLTGASAAFPIGELPAIFAGSFWLAAASHSAAPAPGHSRYRWDAWRRGG